MCKFAKPPIDCQAAHLQSIAPILSDKEGALLTLCRACCQARLQEWDAVRALLGSIDVEQIDEPYRRHALHLLGIVRLRAADLPGARAAWQRALELPGDCKTDECIDWLDALDALDAAQGRDRGCGPAASARRRPADSGRVSGSGRRGGRAAGARSHGNPGRGRGAEPGASGRGGDRSICDRPGQAKTALSVRSAAPGARDNVRPAPGSGRRRC